MKRISEIKKKILAFEKNLQTNMKNIFCPVHLSIGHESVALSISKRLDNNDWLFSYHRNHHHYLAKGGSEKKLLDEIMGLKSGINKGFSGSQSINDSSINFYSTAIVGGLVGVATGAAYALKLNKSNAVVLCCFGDAGVEQGVFWESINFSILNKLPIIYLCENNGKSVDAKIKERQSGDISARVKSFGIKSFKSLDEAIILKKKNKLPSFCEVKLKLKCAHINMATMLDFCDPKIKTKTKESF
jgi:pyruvate dehydrogenase E1 component alpha subunit